MTALQSDEILGEVTIIEQVTREHVDNLMCTAFEGGITYWCDEAQIVGPFPEGATYLHETLSRGNHIRIHDFEEDEWYELTLKKFIQGLQLAIQKYGMTLENFYENHDANYADSVIQHALFMQEVYG